MHYNEISFAENRNIFTTSQFNFVSFLTVSKVVPKLSKIYIFTDSVPSEKNKESPDLGAKKLVMNFYLKETCNVPLVKTFRQKISHNIKKGICTCNNTDVKSDLYICNVVLN